MLHSEVFRFSESLRTLLAYVGEKSLKHEGELLKEYTIGVEAFRKSRDYDPQVDPAVRVIASKLRQKLAEYYLKEGAQDPIRIEMPRGHYALKFVPVPREPAPEEAVLPRTRVERWRTLVWVFAAAACLFAATSVYLGVRLWKGPSRGADSLPWTPELQLIWGPFLKNDRPVIVSLGTPRFTKFKSGFFRNPKVNTDAEASQTKELEAIQKLVGSPFAVPAYPYTGAGEAVGAFRLGRFLEGHTAHLAIRRSSTLHWDTIRTANVIFLGAPKLNLQLYDIPVADGFIIHNGAIRNPKPRPGEPDAYRSTWDPNETDLLEDYALVSRLRNLHGAGEIMALGAGSTEATWAAVEYVTQPEYAKELVSRLGTQSGSLPGCYQIVIRAQFKQQVPVSVSYVTHRVLPMPWLLSGDESPSPPK